MIKVKLANDREFEAKSNLSILDAALDSGIVLPHSCRTGRCGTCKTKVLSGSTHPILSESYLTLEDLNDGWILTCARAADSDVVIDAEDLQGISLPIAKTLPCRIAELEKLSPTVLRIVLRLPPSVNFSFLPGQYIDIIGPGGIRRSYSLANSNKVSHSLELQVASVENGLMSNYWFKKAKINDLLRLNGPLGTFFLRETSVQNLIFLATGTGIAPVKSILESLVSDGDPKKTITVFWGARKPEDFYLDISSMFKGITYIPVLSRQNSIWTGAKGYVQDVLISSNIRMKDSAVYACGSTAMIQSATKKLIDAGLPPQYFYSDAFVSSENN